MNPSDDLKMLKGVTLGRVHTVEDVLGEGTFGVVVKCRNTLTDTRVAVKVFKKHRNSVNNAKEEISVLKQLWALDPDQCHIVRWQGFFFHKENICLNFELLDQNLREFMQYHCALSVQQVRPVVHQLATALSHMSAVGLVHADIKPENIMVVDRHQRPLKVKLADFGLAKNVADIAAGDCVQTLWYRAPEVILGIPFNETVDVWSLGLVAVELATGQPLYPGRTEFDVLSFVADTQGQPADHVLDRGKEVGRYFRKEGDGVRRWKLKSPERFAKETGCQPKGGRALVLNSLDELKVVTAEAEADMAAAADTAAPQRTDRLFVRLVKKMLDLDPDLRVDSHKVLLHPFFHRSRRSESSVDKGSLDEETPCRVERRSPSSRVERRSPSSRVDSLLPLIPKRPVPSGVAPKTRGSNGTCLGRLSKKIVAALRKITAVLGKIKVYSDSPDS
ncbi:homeodomain-interacting protein kinase 2-like [Syngnathus scovelli]|uniref:homeodomain-interacting protein kinase 2-like n=1 Tax=Syngnathus scovelli TaxID=161590 RepID=UPI00211044D2|nr:homeodomain-interacting protein kinase 2-like [Syngnathus scovelli]XP_049578413.1 homeodomain-interacting protein kinase 2-like [Syngnathus scovelli]